MKLHLSQKKNTITRFIPLCVVDQWMKAPSRIFFIRRDKGKRLKVRKIVETDPYKEWLTKGVY